MDIKLFSTLVKHIYSLPINPRALKLLLLELKEQFNSRSLGIHIIDRENLHVISELVSDSEEHDLHDYAHHFHTLRPFLSTIREFEEATNAKEVYVFKHNQLSRLEHAGSLFQKNIVNSGVFSLLFREGSYLVQIAFLDEHNDNAAYLSLVKNISLLRPHIHNAFEVFHTFEECRSRALGFGQTMDQLHSGIILFDGNGEIAYLNRRAKEMISEDPALSIINNKILGSKSTVTRSLRSIIHNAIHAGMDKNKNIGAMKIQINEESIAAIAVPMHPSARALVEMEKSIYAALLLGAAEQPQWLNPEALQLLFQFTPAEAKLAVALSNGKSLEKYAELTGVNVSTPRSHLKIIFQKTATNRQAELVALLRSIPLPAA